MSNNNGGCSGSNASGSYTKISKVVDTKDAQLDDGLVDLIQSLLKTELKPTGQPKSREDLIQMISTFSGVSFQTINQHLTTLLSKADCNHTQWIENPLQDTATATTPGAGSLSAIATAATASAAAAFKATESYMHD